SKQRQAASLHYLPPAKEDYRSSPALFSRTRAATLTAEDAASDHHEVARRQRRAAAERRELHRRAGAVAVGVIEQRAGRLIVDDAVVRVVRGGTGEEGIGVERARPA